jgi:anti-sigma-K factor RskA
LEAAFEQVGSGLKPVALPARAWGKIEERIAAEKPVAGRVGGRGWWGWAAAASVLLMAVLLWRSQENVVRLTAQNAANDERLARVESDLKALAAANAAQVARLATATPYELGAGKQSPQAKLFWNKAEGTWTLVAFGVKPLPAGKTYELWIINDKGEKIAAGTFDPDKEGRAIHEVKLPANAGNIVMAAVTDEVAGGVATPAGAIQFAGKL